MVLLDLLATLANSQQPTANSHRLIVAHFDHGIRADSAKDRLLVQQAADRYGWPFVYDEGHLGAGASEAVAREARYKFLKKVKSAAGAKAIITAHHQDDVLETAVINMLRGTNRRGLTSLKNQPYILRPLLNVPKAELLAYAKAHKIVWHEDSTNQDESYLRNHVRQQIMPRFSPAQKTELLKHIDKLGQLNQDIDALLAEQLKNAGELDRQWFIMLAHNVAREVMASWLTYRGATDVDKKQLEWLVQAAKTFAPGKQADVDKQYILRMSADKLALATRER